MLGVEKLKKSFESVLKEHIVSICVFLLATILWAGNIGSYTNDSFVMGKLIPFIFAFLYMLSAGIVLCESIHLYSKKNDESYSLKSPKYMAVYLLIAVISAVCSFLLPFYNSIYYNVLKERGAELKYINEVLGNISICYIVTAVCLSIFFFYKRSGEKFEAYAVKAFCSLMKAELVYGIIALGVLLILEIINVLIFNVNRFDLIERAEILILGLVEFPCVLLGLSKVEGELSRFSRTVISYVFTSLLTAAFVIIYVYIIKILVTWQFPSNEVFSILTALFFCGLFVWITAGGCCSEKLAKAVRLMPLLFIPFIVLQIMCLYMRVSDYGLTMSRYYGIAVIVFEIVYFVLYFIIVLGKKGSGSFVLFMVIATVFLIYFAPAVNINSAIIRSQKSRIEEYVRLGENADEGIKKAAYEAYNTIEQYGGFAGKRYLESALSDKQIEDIRENSSYGGNDYDSFYISAYNEPSSYGIGGYERLYVVDYSYISLEEKETEYALDAVPVYAGEEEIGTIDLESIVNELIELEKSGDKYNDDKKSKIISEAVPLSIGGVFIITELTVSGDYSEESIVSSISIEGYALK